MQSQGPQPNPLHWWAALALGLPLEIAEGLHWGSPSTIQITRCFYLWLRATVLVDPGTPVVEKVYR